ncbi:hypothetical protein, partial [Escherichia coli]|uniref:hypothetical protein n=1 Tax=Escherichia coli TaxID=562 RepID=UPI001953C00C
ALAGNAGCAIAFADIDRRFGPITRLLRLPDLGWISGQEIQRANAVEDVSLLSVIETCTTITGERRDIASRKQSCACQEKRN